MSEPQDGSIDHPARRLAEIRSWHAPDLSWRQKQAVVALAMGYTVGEIAALMRRTEATVRRHIAEAQSRIFDEQGVAAHHGLVAAWGREHLACCLLPASEMIANDQLFHGK